MNVAIVETNKLHLDGIFDQYDIEAYSVDSTLSAIYYDQEPPPYTIETMTQDEFNLLLQDPAWNHNLIQNEDV